MKFKKYIFPLAQACLGLYLFANGGSLINLDIGVILVLLSMIKGVEIYNEERKHRWAFLVSRDAGVKERRGIDVQKLKNILKFIGMILLIINVNTFPIDRKSVV